MKAWCPPPSTKGVRKLQFIEYQLGARLTGLGTLHTQISHFKLEFKEERPTEREALNLVSPAEPLIILSKTGNQEDLILSFFFAV